MPDFSEHAAEWLEFLERRVSRLEEDNTWLKRSLDLLLEADYVRTVQTRKDIA